MGKNKVMLNEKHLAKIIGKIINESVKRYLSEQNDPQELCRMIKSTYKSVSLKYRMQEYEGVFKYAIENGYSKQDLIDAFANCGLDCKTNPRSVKRFDDIWNSLNKQVSGQINEKIGDDDYSYEEPEEDDWRSEEPSEDDIMMAMKDIEQSCAKYNLKFRDLGNGEFGVICNAGSNADIKGFMNFMNGFTERGMLNNLGSGTTNNGVWHAKFKIIKCW